MRRALTIAALVAALTAVAAPAAKAAPPAIGGTWALAVGEAGATLRAEMDPKGLTTTYRFEYVTEADYLTSEFAGASKIPSGGTTVNSSVVTQRPANMLPATTYLFRAVATNSSGTTIGKLRSLTTDEPGAVFSLADGRGWEMVSPVDKNGGEIQDFGGIFGGGVIQASSQGGAITYSSSASFANAQGAPNASQYVSTRQASGWSTNNVTLPALSGSYPEEAGSGVPYQLFSPDLAAGMVSNGRRCRVSTMTLCPVPNPPLANSGAPAGFRNYYLRDAAGNFHALLDAVDLAGSALGPSGFEIAFAGGTPDLAQVILSSCSALTADATEVAGAPGECDPAKPNLYEKSAGAPLRLINLKPAASTGTPGAYLAAQSRAVSSDGARVYWTDKANLYLREGGATKQVDLAVGGGGHFETASSDGAVAFFSKGGHLYRYDAASGTATDLVPAGDLAGVLGASGNGSYLYYATGAGLFLWHDGTATPISPQVDADSYLSAGGTAWVSADGTHLVFVSTAELTPYDNRNIVSGTIEPEAYLFTAPSGRIVCVSCNPSGERPTGPSSLPATSRNGSGEDAPRVYKPRILSGDAARVFFDSNDALATGDTNGKTDAYQWEAPGSGTCARPNGCVSLISSGRAEGPSTFVDASADGADAFFRTDASLVPADPGAYDIYDARIGGGFPVPASPIPCFGDACQPLPPEPEDPSPGTLRTKASGNQARVKSKPRHCKKGLVKRKGKCYKPKPKKKHKKRRAGK